MKVSAPHITRLIIAAGLIGAISAASAAPLVVDQKASEVSITFTQMNVAVDAQFTRFTIEASFDPASPGDADAAIVIDTASFDFGPGAEEYNAEVRQPEWFDTERFPEARFDAAGAEPTGENKYAIKGNLLIKGVKQSVTAPVVFDKANGKWVFSGKLPIKRLDYGLGATDWKDTSIVADEVVVKFKIVASKP